MYTTIILKQETTKGLTNNNNLYLIQAIMSSGQASPVEHLKSNMKAIPMVRKLVCLSMAVWESIWMLPNSCMPTMA